MNPRAFTVWSIVERGAAVHGEAPAVIAGERALSFRTLRDRAGRLAGGLHALGIGRGDRICILAQNDPAYLELYAACARQGIVAYPINWRLTAAEVERVVDRAAPKMFVTDAASAGVVAGWPASKTAIPHWYALGAAPVAGFRPLDGLHAEGDGAPAPEVASHDPFAVISTAAVDVVPRGAVLTHANVVTADLVAMAAFGLTPSDRYLVALPLFHITALGTALAHLHAGGACVVVARFDPDEAVRLIDRHRVTHLSDFPPVLGTLLDAAEKLGSRLPSLRDVAGLDAPGTIQRLHETTSATFWTGFGQSETTGFVSIQRVKERPGSAGRPVAAADVRLVDDDDREVPAGTAGEIVVRGPLVFDGYFAQPGVTAVTFRNGWHHTGDVGRFDAEGYLAYVGRKPEKELIKPGGENVYPAEVETVIVQMEGVTGACVYGVPDARWGEAIKAVVAPAGRYTAEQISDFVGRRIARFKRPHVVVFTDALPRRADGAVDRDAAKTRWGTSS
jgi:acyl-CoA synthetase (AMP-forming)/AMP-acid ligase II